MSKLDPLEKSVVLDNINKHKEKYEARSLLITKISRYSIIGLVVFFACAGLYILLTKSKIIDFHSSTTTQENRANNSLTIPTITTAIYSGSSCDQENENISLNLVIEVADSEDMEDLRQRIPEISEAVTLFLSQVYKSDFSTTQGVQTFKAALFLYLRHLLSPCEIKNVFVVGMAFH